MDNKHEKTAYYTGLIIEAVKQVIEENDLMDELDQGQNLTHFIHSFTNQAPSIFFASITGDQKSFLEFNHLANHLIFQYSKID